MTVSAGAVFSRRRCIRGCSTTHRYPTFRGVRPSLLRDMIKCATLVVLLGLVGCGDNHHPDLAPEFSSPRIEMTMAEDGTLAIDATASDPEGRALTYEATAPQHGTLSGTAPLYTYTPDAHFVGIDAFTITVSDGVSSIDIPVTITVRLVDVAPVADGQELATPMNLPLGITLQATDADSATLTYAIVDWPAHGVLGGTAPDLTYTPDADFQGSDEFSFSASDGFVTSDIATIAITVTQCGNGITEAGEDCDDGNTEDGDGCGHTCKIEGCGDGIVQPALGETCDDGNRNSGDGCDASCHTEVVCAIGRCS
ncbi:MAG: DUF4215 domain-containing protein [Deltaproteobacteria bacterium]|nr:MAG: DUF4215 domain-containing protein [Deltaproteobacteria bacterium]